MKLNTNRISHQLSVLGITVLSAFVVVGCSKKNNETTNETTESSQASDVTTQKEANAQNQPEIQCSDDIALQELNHTIKESLVGQSDRLLSVYSDRAGTQLGFDSVKTVVETAKIDIAEPKQLQPINNSGMLACSANLSITLPNNDVNRAREVYQSLDSTNLDAILNTQNITITNNMLVSNNFRYVVGMQGGQASAKLIGEPALLTAVADIIAKSKLKSTLDVNRRTVHAGNISKPKVTPRPTPAPKPRPEPQPEVAEPLPTTPELPLTPEPSPSEAPAPTDKAQANTKADNKDTKPATEFTVPSDESIEMVIIEEEGTY